MPQGRDTASKPSFSTISIDTSVSAQQADHLRNEGVESGRERPLSTTLGVRGFFLALLDDSVVEWDTGDTADLARFHWLGYPNQLLESRGFPRVSAYPSKARVRIGDGRIGEVRRGADIPAGVTWRKGKCTAFALDADIPALMRDGVMESLGGQSEFSRDSLVLVKQGVAIALRVNRVGRYILCVVDFGEDASRQVRGPAVSASHFGRAFFRKIPNMPNGGLHLPYTEDGLYQFDPPRTFSACNAGSLGDSMDGCLPDPNRSVMKFRANWGRASAQLLRRVLVD